MAAPEETENDSRSQPAGATFAERFPALHVPITAKYEPEDFEQLQFSLKEMFLVTTAAAIMLALFLRLQIFGAVLSFLSAVLFTVVAIPWLMPRQAARQCKIFDFVWGVIMPLVCLVFLTPVMLSNNVEEFRFGGPLLALHTCTMTVVLVAGKSVKRISPFLTGVLAVGLTFWLMIMVLLALPAIMFTIYYGVGLLGFSPVFASIAVQRRMRLMNDLGQEIPGRFAMLLAGILLSVLGPLAIGTALTIISHFQPPL